MGKIITVKELIKGDIVIWGRTRLEILSVNSDHAVAKSLSDPGWPATINIPVKTITESTEVNLLSRRQGR